MASPNTLELRRTLAQRTLPISYQPSPFAERDRTMFVRLVNIRVMSSELSNRVLPSYRRRTTNIKKHRHALRMIQKKQLEQSLAAA